MTDSDYADDLAHHENAPTLAKFLLHGLEQTASSIGLYANANKIKFMSFKPEEA